MIRFSRRSFLRGLSLGAGAAMLSPLVSRLASAEDTLPRRFVFVVEGNGFEPITMLSSGARAALDPTLKSPVGDRRWWYRDYQHDTPMEIESNDLGTARSLGGLRALGLEDRASVVLGLSSKVSGGGHSNAHGCLSSSRSIAGSPGGPTIDATISEVSVGKPFDAVRLGVGTGNSLNFGTVAYDAGRPAPMILKPATAYGILFGSVGGSTDFANRGDLLDFAAADVAAVRSQLRSGPERDKLEAYLASLEELRGRQDTLERLSGQLQAVAPEDPSTNPLYQSPDALDVFAAQAELATAALLGELTNVVVLGSGTGGDFNLTYHSVAEQRRHDIQHGSAGSAEMLEAAHTVSERQVEILAQMARTLADTPEPTGGSMLDHTLIVYVSENGEQHHSTASEFPALLIGGEALGMRQGGRSVIYPGYNSGGHRQLSNLWNSVGYLAGMELDEFGTEGPGRQAAGPLSELFA